MPQTGEAKAGELRLTFAALRESLAVHSERLLVTIDKPGDYQLCSCKLKDRAGRPLFVADHFENGRFTTIGDGRT